MFKVESRPGNVAILHMDDGKVNAIGPRFLAAFPAAWREASADGRAVVLAGNARAFSAGLDLKTLPTMERDELVRFARGFLTTFRDLWAHERPTVAAVDGPALAGGAFLALCCDLRVAGDRARIGLTETPIGIPFPPALLELVRHELPANEVGPAVLQGVVREGADAVARGWAHRHGPFPLDVAVAQAAQLAEFSAAAYGPSKRALRGGVTATLDAFLARGPEAWVEHLLREETMEGILRSFARVTGR